MIDKKFPYINESGQIVYNIIPGDGKYIEYWEVISSPDAAVEGMSGVCTKDGKNAFTVSDRACERMNNMFKNGGCSRGCTISIFIKPALFILGMIGLTALLAWIFI